MFLFCLVFAMFCARLFICALWSPAGKGLTSWLSFVVSSVSLSLSHWYPGSGVVLDCIDSWSLHHYLLLLLRYKTFQLKWTRNENNTCHGFLFNSTSAGQTSWMFWLKDLFIDERVGSDVVSVGLTVGCLLLLYLVVCTVESLPLSRFVCTGRWYFERNI